VYEWFQKTLVIIAGVSSFNQALTFNLFDSPSGKQQLLRFLQAADLGIAGIDLKREALPTGAGGGMFMGQGFIEQKPGKCYAEPYPGTFAHQADDDEPITFDISQESSGTQILFHSAGRVAQCPY